ncbi:MAG: peptidylprolyl isomerase [Devosia sp.]
MIAVSRRLFAGLALAAAALFAAPAWAQTGTPHLMLTLPAGVVDIELLPDLAPNHVERIVALTNDHFYDGLKFHRVIAGFMAQTGDPKGDGTGGSDLPDLKAEFTTTQSFQRGVLGMARAQDPDSANSQFFITYADASFLDGQYTVFGKVVSGMEAVDALKKGSEADNGAVTDPDTIISAKIEYK